ncbi:cupin domain-containing protein [Xanthomonas sp. AmX2]|uniref:cupin domain-containing protein n=1 Tax=Xanthomonas sp. TaxID=29446 RepID=UPI00197E2E81|nr:cupin domain-containing protein [Xanthomonas sp.]
MRQISKVALIVAVGVAVGTVVAQDRDPGGIEGIKWTELQKVVLADAPGKHEILGIANIAPGATAGLHIHEDYEVGYVLEGEFLLKTRGEPDRTLRAGESFKIAPKTAHAATNTGKVPMKVLVTYIVDTDKPLAEPPN